ncbi:hypothetical protein D6764_03690 [Candidatus Woesearchaeota archaeon]|nr:MAG: hypothetical protein D6764_03690 [Candidatus Woesearchaeota archaeon]
MIRKDARRAIKEFFFTHPSEKLRVREIERKLDLSLPSVIEQCKRLEKEGILAKVEIGSVFFYTAARTNRKYILEKKLFNIRRLYESGLVDYLKEELHNPTILLFGSYSRGEDTEESDIDLYLETSSKKTPELHSFEAKLKRKIHIFKHKNIHEIKNPHLANNIINGITLNGYIEVFK